MFKKLALVAVASALAAFLLISTPTKQGTQLFTGGEQEIEKAFIQFIAKYGRSYASKAEVPQRYEVFKATYKMIEEHNAREDVSFKMGVNQFADRLPKELPQSGIKVDDDITEFHDSKKFL